MSERPWCEVINSQLACGTTCSRYTQVMIDAPDLVLIKKKGHSEYMGRFYPHTKWCGQWHMIIDKNLTDRQFQQLSYANMEPNKNQAIVFFKEGRLNKQDKLRIKELMGVTYGR